MTLDLTAIVMLAGLAAVFALFLHCFAEIRPMSPPPPVKPASPPPRWLVPAVILYAVAVVVYLWYFGDYR